MNSINQNQSQEESTSDGFSINACACTLKYNTKINGGIILGNDIKYVIPIYQRPYSWTEEQISKFISDIFSSYWCNEGQVLKEPMFMGTIQLSGKYDKNKHDIIDGQQRLTTFLILLKVLKVSYPSNKELQSMNFDWLSTNVNNGEQEIYLKEAIESDLTIKIENLNPYLKSAFLIKDLLNEHTSDENDQTLNFKINNFIEYLLRKIYFVVIKTHAGLSKTIQIFNAINTTGLDLNGGDIFKIRMYEYLKNIKKENETSFDKISELYQKIDQQNEDLKYKASDILDILSIYQFILIAKYELPAGLYNYATDTFYEGLFDMIFGVRNWKDFNNNVNKVELSLDEIECIIEMRYAWERNWYHTAEDACAYSFISWSRYRRYRRLLFVFLFVFKDEENLWEKFFLFTRQLSKLYIIYSIRFLKAVNEIHTFNHDLIKYIMTESMDEVIKRINEKIGTPDNHKGLGDFKEAINGDITNNRKIKDIICRLSAMLEENHGTTNKTEIETIREMLFEKPIDIEHIQAYNDINEDQRKRIWADWGDNINSIGNLVVLEFDKNRSIQNKAFPHKIEKYSGSSYSIIKNLISQYPEWHLENCKKRKKSEVEKLLNYLFDL